MSSQTSQDKQSTYVYIEDNYCQNERWHLSLEITEQKEVQQEYYK